MLVSLGKHTSGGSRNHAGELGLWPVGLFVVENFTVSLLVARMGSDEGGGGRDTGLVRQTKDDLSRGEEFVRAVIKWPLVAAELWIPIVPVRLITACRSQ